MFSRLPRLDESGHDRHPSGVPRGLPGEQETIVVIEHRDDHRRIGAWEHQRTTVDTTPAGTTNRDDGTTVAPYARGIALMPGEQCQCRPEQFLVGAIQHCLACGNRPGDVPQPLSR